MTGHKSSSPESEPRVLRFPRDRSALRGPPPVNDLAKYEHGTEPDDYRHRMIVNLAAFLFVILLIGAGYWLADTMARIRKNQDCMLSGRRDCAPVEVNRNRW